MNCGHADRNLLRFGKSLATGPSATQPFWSKRNGNSARAYRVIRGSPKAARRPKARNRQGWTTPVDCPPGPHADATGRTATH